jgi:hypothetical protein
LSLEPSYRRARIIGRVGRVVMVVGLILTMKDVAEAAERSLTRRSFKPPRRPGRQSWRPAMAQSQPITWRNTSVAFGIEAGPGAVAFAAVGAIVFGALGYFGADLVAQAAWGDDE